MAKQTKTKRWIVEDLSEGGIQELVLDGNLALKPGHEKLLPRHDGRSGLRRYKVLGEKIDVEDEIRYDETQHRDHEDEEEEDYSTTDESSSLGRRAFVGAALIAALGLAGMSMKDKILNYDKETSRTASTEARYSRRNLFRRKDEEKQSVSKLEPTLEDITDEGLELAKKTERTEEIQTKHTGDPTKYYGSAFYTSGRKYAELNPYQIALLTRFNVPIMKRRNDNGNSIFFAGGFDSPEEARRFQAELQQVIPDSYQTSFPRKGAIDVGLEFMPEIKEYDSIIHGLTSRYINIPEGLAKAILRTENEYDRKTSHAGARGPMQLMPGTFKLLQKQNPELKDIDNPYDNIHAGVFFLDFLWRKYHDWDIVIMAYNAGESVVDKVAEGKRGFKDETLNYLDITKGHWQAINEGIDYGEYYVIKRGQTLSKVASTWCTSVNYLETRAREFNPEFNKDKVWPGNIIRL